jgi:intracellular sulfur oxidation DsrE/DsrF family protein
MYVSRMKATAAVVFAAVLGFSTWAWTQSQPAAALPVAGYGAARDVPGAHELPDPSMTYKVVFDIAKAAPKAEDVNPGLVTVARYLNTLAKYGVPADHRKIAVVLHQDATPMIQNDAAYKAGHDGHDNPNVAIIRNMKKAGVDFRVCGQSVLAHKIDTKTIMPEIELDLWALNTMVTLELRGYVHIGGS